MPNCLGIYIEKNIIKYAKISKDRTTFALNVDSYGLKFYDNLSETVGNIVRETDSDGDLIAVNLSGEGYSYFDVFSRLNPKDMKQVVNTEFESFCLEKGIPINLTDMRYVLVKNSGKNDTYKAICISANDAELTNLSQIFSSNRLESISSIGLSVTNLLNDAVKKEDCAIVNIEDTTKITIYLNNEISHIENIPIGMNDVISRVADKYNSYSKAYEACKSVSIYVNNDYDIDEGNQEILNLLLPTFYDLRQRVSSALKPYVGNIKKIYITGMGVIINNVDLYFQEYFEDKVCEILTPFFVNKDSSNLKDIVEVNSAIAVALNGIFGIDKQTDFYSGSKGYLKGEALKKKVKEFSAKDAYDKVSVWMNEFNDRFKVSSPKKNAKPTRRVEVAFDEVEQLDKLNEQSGDDKQISSNVSSEVKSKSEENVYYDFVDAWLIRLSLTLVAALAIYSGVSLYTQSLIDTKMALTNQRKSITDSRIQNVKTDTEYVKRQADDYKTKTDKLTKIIESIKTRTERSYDIPNFMSQLMFVIPEDVKVTSIRVEEEKTVLLEAQSGKYNQLGYFVSKIKLEGVLKDVDMEVVSMDSNIKIKINGVLP